MRENFSAKFPSSLCCTWLLESSNGYRFIWLWLLLNAFDFPSIMACTLLFVCSSILSCISTNYLREYGILLARAFSAELSAKLVILL